ncbi:hypothetical protein [Micromonospora sp. DT47]|uniref:hypothetical protein n=1 Tax=Micromonospora sp. DT47 TaxID=3393431 RepID=UPI003CF977EB
MMRRRAPQVLLSLLLVAGVAACGTSEAAPTTARWSAPVSAAPTTTPPPRPAPRSADEVSRQTRIALLDLSKFRPETVSHTKENTEGWYLRAPCRRELPSDRHSIGQRERRWETSPVWIRQHVVGYQKVTGRKLVDELRATMRGCRSYRMSNGETSTLVPWAPAGAPKNPDVVTFCERHTTDTGTYHQCTVTMARGYYVMEVDASDGDGDLAKSKAMLTKLYPSLTAALVKAA